MQIAKIADIPVFRAVLEDIDEGMTRISLVDEPAVMKNFMKFSGHQVQYSIESEEKRLVYGVVMRADFPIYRRDLWDGEYYVVYPKDVIRKMAEKYLRENRQNNIDLQHDKEEVQGVKMVQFFIKDSEKGVIPKGFDDVADGSLFAEFHIMDEGIWKAVKDGTFKGFSLEGFFDMEPESDQNGVNEIVRKLEGKFEKMNKLNIKEKMSKLKNFKDAFRKLLAEMTSVTTDKGVLTWDGEDDVAVGTEVFIQPETGDRTPAEDGDYVDDAGRTITVKGGKVETIAEPGTPAPAEESKEEEEAKKQQKCEDDPMAEPCVPEGEPEGEGHGDPEIKDISDRLAKLEEVVSKIADNLGIAAVKEDMKKISERLSVLEKEPSAKGFEKTAKGSESTEMNVDKLPKGLAENVKAFEAARERMKNA